MAQAPAPSSLAASPPLPFLPPHTHRPEYITHFALLACFPPTVTSSQASRPIEFVEVQYRPGSKPANMTDIALLETRKEGVPFHVSYKARGFKRGRTGKRRRSRVKMRFSLPPSYMILRKILHKRSSEFWKTGQLLVPIRKGFLTRTVIHM